MKITKDSIDDVLRALYLRLMKSADRVTPTRGGTREITGVLLELTNPRARISRAESRGKIRSCIAEFLWYMSGKNDLDFIAYYLRQYREESEDGLTVYGGYGPRLFGDGESENQIENVIGLLKSRPTSRRAVIQIFDSSDIAGRVRPEIPCTCTLQFLIREGRLELIVSMRSNDALRGLPHDIFAFTMIQEVLARSLGVELGSYQHFVGSMHLYDNDLAKVRDYLSEGWQGDGQMPAMPPGDPWRSIQALLKLEAKMRSSAVVRYPQWLNGYWKDFALILQIHSAYKRNDPKAVARAKARISSDVYRVYFH